MAELQLVPVSGQPIVVAKDPTVVGRDPGCEIVVTDGSVSRRHARLEQRSGEWWVVDQGSANGTYVNSTRIAEQALAAGQELRFGALAYRVQLAESDATVATPVLDDSATLLAPSLPAAAAAAAAAAPPVPVAPPPPPSVPPAAVAPPPPPPQEPPAPPPVPQAPPPPPAPPRPAAPPPPAGAPRPRASGSPVPQMPAGPRAAKKGRSPLVWVLAGCCGCLLLAALLVGIIAGGAFMATKPAADATQAWLADVRAAQVENAMAGLSSDYRNRLTDEELQAIATAIQASTDATFMQRSVENDRAVLKGVLTGGAAPQPITVSLVKEGGAWKIDGISLSVE